MAAFEVADWTANAGQLYRGFCVAKHSKKRIATVIARITGGLCAARRGRISIERAEVLELTDVSAKTRLWRSCFQLRERLSKYFGVRDEVSLDFFLLLKDATLALGE